MGMSA